MQCHATEFAIWKNEPTAPGLARSRDGFVQPSVTPCNAVQPPATDSAIWKNEPTVPARLTQVYPSWRQLTQVYLSTRFGKTNPPRPRIHRRCDPRPTPARF